jgi:outer membrane protein
MKKYFASFVCATLLIGFSAHSETQAPQYTWTLNEVRKYAESQNPDLKTALAHLDAANAVITQAWSGYLPHVDVTAKFDQTNLPSPSAGLTEQLGTVLPYTSTVARVRQTLFDFGKTLNDVGYSKALSHSSEQTLVALKNIVDLTVQKAFYNVSAAEKLVEVAAKGVDRFEETRRRTAVLVKTGARPSFDLSQANVELSKAKLSLINAENNRDIARITLLNIMGMPKEVPFKISDPTPSDILNLDKMSVDTLTARAIDSRPELKRSSYLVEASQMQVHKEYKEYLPELSAEGWYGKYLPNFPTETQDAWGAGLALTWNIFDGLKTTGRVREYSADLEARTSEFEKERLQIIAEVASSFLGVKKAISNLQVASETIVFAEENSRLARRRYDSNVATFLELLVAETSLLDAQAVNVAARYQYENSLATLKQSVNAPIN